MNRRKFIRSSTICAGFAYGITYSPWAFSSAKHSSSIIPDLRQKIKVPVIIRSIKLLNYGENFLVLTRTEDGMFGIAQGNRRLANMITFFKNQVVPFFIGKDARDIERLIEQVYTYNRNYKYVGMALWNSVAHVEISILDLLGQVASLPVNQLIGTVKRSEIPVYLSSLERGTTPEEEVDWVSARMAETNTRAVKLKMGGRMSKNKDAYPGRSENLIKHARKSWGKDVTIYFDANGSYEVAKAIEMGKLLEDHAVGFYEEPVPWEDFAGTKQVNEGLNIPVAGGEQDNSIPKWKWMIDNKALDIVQPDIMYNGGLIRTLQVARLANDAGLPCTVHSPKTNALAAYMLHFASIIENPGLYQEFRAKLPNDESYFSPNIQVKNGKASVPEGPGFGINYDQEYLKKASII